MCSSLPQLKLNHSSTTVAANTPPLKPFSFSHIHIHLRFHQATLLLRKKLSAFLLLNNLPDLHLPFEDTLLDGRACAASFNELHQPSIQAFGEKCGSGREYVAGLIKNCNNRAQILEVKESSYRRYRWVESTYLGEVS